MCGKKPWPGPTRIAHPAEEKSMLSQRDHSMTAGGSNPAWGNVGCGTLRLRFRSPRLQPSSTQIGGKDGSGAVMHRSAPGFLRRRCFPNSSDRHDPNQRTIDHGISTHCLHLEVPRTPPAHSCGRIGTDTEIFGCGTLNNHLIPKTTRSFPIPPDDCASMNEENVESDIPASSLAPRIGQSSSSPPAFAVENVVNRHQPKPSVLLEFLLINTLPSRLGAPQSEILKRRGEDGSV